MERVWILRNFDTGSVLAFTAEHLAMHAAERMVGNRAVAVGRGVLLYGPGDGTTSVLIESCTRDEALRVFPEITLPVEQAKKG